MKQNNTILVLLIFLQVMFIILLYLMFDLYIKLMFWHQNKIFPG